MTGMTGIDWAVHATRYTFRFIRDLGTVETMPIHIEACDQRDGSTLWAVRQAGNCLRTDLDWEHESIPSDRDGQWIREHRFASKHEAYMAMRDSAVGDMYAPAYKKGKP